jgi:hypothetical protein
MKRFLAGTGRALGPDGLGGVWKWLIAGALTFGIAPTAVQAQDTRGRFSSATLFGLPVEDGRVRWPFGLLILPPARKTKALRDQLELALYFVATQASEGKVNRVFIDFGLDAVHDLRQLLRADEEHMPAGTYREAMRFLDRAGRGLTKIKRAETSPGDAPPLRGAPSGPSTEGRRTVMLRRSLFVGVGALALVAGLGAPGQLHARPMRGGFPNGARPGFRSGAMPGFRGGMFTPGLNRGMFAPGFNRGAFTPGLNRGTFTPGLNRGMFAPGFNRGAFNSRFNRGFDRRFDRAFDRRLDRAIDRRFDRRLDREFFDPRFSPGPRPSFFRPF